MKNQLKVLHLASFVGNIGDNANHMGFRQNFEKHVHPNAIFNELEIRDFYRQEKFYDESFVDLVNQHDLFIVGGGNYFELWPENSPTGTSVGFSTEQMSRFKTPVLFNALGVDIGQGIGKGSAEKFEKFLEFCRDRPNILISVRNDGAMKNLREHFNKTLTEGILNVPDGAFGCKFVSKAERDGKRLIGLNIASDMEQIRFAKYGMQTFVEQIVQFIKDAYANGYKTILIPHIHKDLLFIADVLKIIANDRVLRNGTIVAPCEQFDSGLQKAVDSYQQCDVIFAMRFHANILGMLLRKPTFGLCNYVQIENLYAGMELTDKLIFADSQKLGENMIEKLMLIKDKKWRIAYADILNARLDIIDGQILDYMMRIKSWLVSTKRS